MPGTGHLLLCADVLDGLRALPDDSVDAVVTDPPYGERAASWDGPRSSAWHHAWMTEAHRALRPLAPLVTFCSRRTVDVVMGSLRAVRGDTAELPLQTGAWVHRQGHPIGSGLLRPEHEPWIASGLLRTEADDVRGQRLYRSPHNIDRKPTHRRENARGFRQFTYTPHELGPMAGTVFECARNKPAEATGHPTQKPEAAIAYLVLLACPPGGLVLDPFTGSGTTGKAALRFGRRFIGIDLSPAYLFGIARQRVAAADVGASLAEPLKLRTIEGPLFGGAP